MEASLEFIEADVIVIGAGPAGLTAALYASRANLKTYIIERGAPGGEMNNTAEIENYTGYTQISGVELSQKMYESAMAFDAHHDYGDVERIEIDNDIKKVYTSSKVYLAPVVILATGAYNRPLGVKGEDRLRGSGVSYCAVCDGFFFKDRHVVVVGGGDSAVEEGTYLTQFAKEVTIIHRRDELRATHILQKRASKNPKVKFIWDSVVEEILGDQSVEGIRIKNVKTDEVSDIETDGVFIYVGVVPRSSLVKELGVTDDEGWVITNSSMETEIPGLFAVGDVRSKNLRQVATAVGDGSIAGNQAYHYIQSLN